MREVAQGQVLVSEVGRGPGKWGVTRFFSICIGNEMSRTEGHPHLHRRQRQCRNLWCRLVPTGSWCRPQSCDARQFSALRDPGWVLQLQVPSTAPLTITGLQPEAEADYHL